MPQVCSVCRHPQLAAINQALVVGTPLRHIAEQHGLSSTALFRHRNEHIPAALTQAHGAAEAVAADDLLGQVRDLQAITLGILKTADEGGEPLIALKAIGEARRNLELLAKLLGELDERPTVNVLVAPEWHALRTRIVVALAPFPDARLALAGVLTDAS